MAAWPASLRRMRDCQPSDFSLLQRDGPFGAIVAAASPAVPRRTCALHIACGGASSRAPLPLKRAVQAGRQAPSELLRHCCLR
jgi:hypothetical protein